MKGRGGRGERSLLARLGRVAAALAAVAFAIVAYVYLTLPDVRVLAATNPTKTAWMEMRQEQAEDDNQKG